MKALDLALMFLKDKEVVKLSEKQVKWLCDLIHRDGDGPPYTGTIGFTNDGKTTIELREGKRMISAYGGGFGTRRTGKFCLIRSSNP
jgi:hypothetical protein